MKRSFLEAFAEVASAGAPTYVLTGSDYSYTYESSGYEVNELGPFDLDLSHEPEPMSILYAESMEMEAVQRGVSLSVNDGQNALLKGLRLIRKHRPLWAIDPNDEFSSSST